MDKKFKERRMKGEGGNKAALDRFKGERMDWFYFTDSDGRKRIVNADQILSAEYHEDTNLTIIEFARSMSPAAYINGEEAFRRLRMFLTSHNHSVGNLGD